MAIPKKISQASHESLESLCFFGSLHHLLNVTLGKQRSIEQLIHHQEHVRQKQSLISDGVQELLLTQGLSQKGCYPKMDWYYRYPFIPPFNIELAGKENTSHSKNLMKHCAETSWDLTREVGHHWLQPDVICSYLLPGWKTTNRKWVA